MKGAIARVLEGAAVLILADIVNRWLNRRERDDDDEGEHVARGWVSRGY